MPSIGERTPSILESVSEQGQDVPTEVPPLGLSDLARLQGAVPVTDPRELTAKVWDSDEELDAFLADLRASRHAALG